jgi:hypothetical protein
MLVNIKWTRYEGKRSWPNLKQCPVVCPEGLRDSRCPHRDSNPWFPKYTSQALPLGVDLLSVTYCTRQHSRACTGIQTHEQSASDKALERTKFMHNTRNYRITAVRYVHRISNSAKSTEGPEHTCQWSQKPLKLQYTLYHKGVQGALSLISLYF